jgi:hypothetical protein
MISIKIELELDHCLLEALANTQPEQELSAADHYDLNWQKERLWAAVEHIVRKKEPEIEQKLAETDAAFERLINSKKISIFNDLNAI